jgi:hypothetical protein
MRNQLLWGAAAIALVAPAGAMAQETTSSIRGTVVAGGAPVAGATVTIVHEPSGTRSTTTTDARGAFTAQGLRIGGPFTVSVSAPGYADTQITDINTVLGQPYTLPIEVTAADEGAADVVVTASRVPSARTISQGPVTVLGAEDISRIASVNRDVRDLMRRDPFATLDTSQTTGRQVTFAGQNARFNRFTVDGVPLNDSFGLNPDGLPSRRGPVPLDAIGQFQTKVAPFDIREGFFQGGVINAVLRSGTNKFQGTGFFTYSDDNLVGERTKAYGTNNGRVDQGGFISRDFGAELSGPIIKDKLFFMIAGERVRARLPVTFGTTEQNSGAPVVGLDDATLQRVLDAYNVRYSDRADGGILRSAEDKDDRLVGKLDANLSDTQRLAITGFYTKDSLVVSSTTNNNSLGLASNAYVKPNETYGGIVQLNSDWSDNFSTEARGLYRKYESGQFPNAGTSSAFTICSAETSDRSNDGAATTTNASTSCPANVASVVIGPGGPSQSNILDVETFGGSFLGRLSLNNHNLRLLAEFADTKVFNQFVNNYLGSYYFDSLTDLRQGNAQSLSYQNAPSLDPADAAARFRYQTYTFGIQDDIRVTDTLNVSLGMRYDLFGGNSRPALNQNFLNRYGFTNINYISGRGLFQPRVGFDWAPTERLSIRGGGGIFGGGTPDVYIGNSFSVSGVLSSSVSALVTDGGLFQLNGSRTPANAAIASQILNGVNINNVNPAAPAVIAASDPTISTTTSVNALDPNFKVPSQWRATLSADYRLNLGPLGDDWIFGVDGFFSRVRDQVLITDIRSIPRTGIGSTTPDGRQRYQGLLGNGDSGQDLIMTNTGRGRSFVGVVRFDKDWDFGLGLGGSFTYQDVRDQSPLTSSQAGSLYGNSANEDPNRPAYGHANEEIKYQFKYNLRFERAFFGDARTRFDLFGETRIGSPYSYTFQDVAGNRNGAFGTAGTASRYLFYVPTGIDDPLVTYAAGGGLTAAQIAERIDSIVENSDLSKYRGKIAPRNAFNSKWFTKIDFHIEQEVPVVLGAKLSVFADVENVLNLLNRNWGQQLRSFFPYNKVVARVGCSPTTTGGVTNPCGQYVYSQPSTDAALLDQLVTTNGSSLYAVRLGARISF